MKVLFFCVCLTLLSWIAPINSKDVTNDFGKRFNEKRFSRNVLFINENYQDNIFDTMAIKSNNVMKASWLKINLILGRCDYIIINDSNHINCFLIFSDKAYLKFWVKYFNNKIEVIKVIKPKIFNHLIPPPCGY